MARPRKQIDPLQVEQLAGYGCIPEEIAAVLDANVRTVQRRFATSIKKGHRKLHSLLKRELVKQAVKGNSAALIFALKVYCGFKEPRDDAVTVNVSANATATGLYLSDEQKRDIEELATTIQQRVYKRIRDPAPSGNGNSTTALN